MLRSFILASTALSSFALSSTPTTDGPVNFSDLIVHETTSALPSTWRYRSAANDDQILHLRLTLSDLDPAYLQVAKEVSDPDSKRYGKYLGNEELQALLTDMQPTADLVTSWLKADLTNDTTVTGDHIDFETTVAKARAVLKADFAWYSHQSEEPVLRTLSYSVPASLSNDVSFIYPTVQFLSSFSKRPTPAARKRQHIPTAAASCDNSVCPAQLKKKYNIDYQPANKSSGSHIGIAGFLEQYPNTVDLRSFLKQHGLKNHTSPYDYTVESTNGGKNPQTAATSGVEAMLDLDYAAAFTDPLSLTFYSTGGRPPTLSQPGNKNVPANESQNEPFLALLQYIVAQKAPPQVLSISYSDNEQSVPLPYANKVCNLFAKLAARGVSVIVASGDGGASGTDNGDCKGPKGKQRFVPTFPSSCPWVTSVGATADYGGAASFSSGGFSNYFGRPGWQNASAELYITEIKGAHAGYYNKSGRGIPDVSLLGDDYLIISGGYPSSHDGTSAPTPVFAAMIALINDIRLRAGQPVLGHLNPLLYSAKVKAAFKDITTGNNNGCADSTTFEPGYDALQGWDPVTGLGEPDFSKLRKLLS